MSPFYLRLQQTPIFFSTSHILLMFSHIRSIFGLFLSFAMKNFTLKLSHAQRQFIFLVHEKWVLFKSRKKTNNGCQTPKASSYNLFSNHILRAFSIKISRQILFFFPLLFKSLIRSRMINLFHPSSSLPDINISFSFSQLI